MVFPKVLIKKVNKMFQIIKKPKIKVDKYTKIYNNKIKAMKYKM